MLSNIICGLIGIVSGFVICSLATASKIASLHEEYSEIIENVEKKNNKEK